MRNAMDGLRLWEPRALGILRIMCGLLLIHHGTQKLFDFPSLPPGAVITPLLQVGAVLELAGGAFIAAGLFTRPVAFVLSGEMAVAYFHWHAPTSFFPAVNHGDAAILFCLIFLHLVFAGSGAWGLDAILTSRRARGGPRTALAGAPNR